MASKAKYNGFIGAAQVSIDQARARGEERVTLPMKWAVALSEYATALWHEQEIATVGAQSDSAVTIAQLEAKIAALTAEVENGKKIAAALTGSTIAATRRSVQLVQQLEDSKVALSFFADSTIDAMCRAEHAMGKVEQLTKWLEKSQSEELRLRQAHYEEQQRAEGLSARARTLQADNDRLRDEAQRWETAYQGRGELVDTQQDSVMHLLDRVITLSKQVEANGKPCAWRHDPGGIWLTGCGSVADRYAPFCPFCGHKVEKVKP